MLSLSVLPPRQRPPQQEGEREKRKGERARGALGQPLRPRSAAGMPRPPVCREEGSLRHVTISYRTPVTKRQHTRLLGMFTIETADALI